MESFFNLKKNNTSIKTEVIAGITTFVSMAYIIILAPQVLGQTGIPVQGVFLATVLVAVLGTAIMGLFANVPFAIAPGISMNAYFTYTIVFGFGFKWQQALGIVFFVGLIDVVLTLSGARKAIVKSIPNALKAAIAGGIGLFIAYVGLKNAGFINFIIDPNNITSVNNKPFHIGDNTGVINSLTGNGGVTPELATFNSAPVILAAIGLIILTILILKKVTGAFLIAMILTTIIGIPMGVTQTVIPQSASFSSTFHDFGHVFGAAFGANGLPSLFKDPQTILITITTVFAMGFTGLFDAIGTLLGIGEQTGIFTKDEQKSFEDSNSRGIKTKIERSLVADTFATAAAGVLGTSNTTTFIESSSGVAAGGRTGLTNVVTAVLFAVSVIAAPFVSIIPSVATAPILILVGVMMMAEFKKIEWENLEIAIPAFFTAVLMAFTYSISYGIAIGFLFYIVAKVIMGKAKELNITLVIITLLFIVNFVLVAMSLS